MEKRELERIGGEAEFLVLAKEGTVKDAYFISTAPVRGFERLLKGKSPIFALQAVMRICGICFSAHGIASVEAIEEAIGILPPPNGRNAREALGLLNRIQSHLLHLMLLTPDLVEDGGRIMYGEIELLNKISNLLQKLGGAPTHPPFLVIGGVERLPEEGELGRMVENLRELKEEFLSLWRDLLDCADGSDALAALREKEYAPDFLATHLFYGDRYNLDVDSVEVLHYHEFRGEDAPEEAKMSTSMVALYRGRPVEVGPRARLSLYRDFSDRSLWGLQAARMVEITMAIDRVISLIEEIDPREPCKTERLVFKRGRGIGVYEAPRGTLIHKVALGPEGRIIDYQITVPTEFNIPHMEGACRGLSSGMADLVPRIYDPCIPCATHVMEVGENA